MKVAIVLSLLLISTSLWSESHSYTTIVESDMAHYDGIKLTLNGHVFVENAMGKVNANQAILIRDEKGMTKIDFPWVELNEHVTLRFSNGSYVQCHQLSLNYVNLTSTLIGRPQVYYRDAMGEIYANQAILEYEESDQNLQPTKVTLIGNVHLIRNPLMDHKDKAHQYALADWVQFFPKDEFMVLKAEAGKRVLFYDTDKDLQLSARVVEAKKRGPEGKETIQGLGDVRFIFKEEEFNKLKEQFHWNEHTP